MDRRTLIAASLASMAAGTVTAGKASAQSAGGAVTPKVPAAAHVFKLGDFSVAAVHDGSAQRPLPPGFIRNLSDAETAAAFAAVGLPADKLSLTFTPMLVSTGKNLVLFDTGFADTGGPTTGKLIANLAAIGIKPEDIDTVVLSHFHGDHINGLRDKAGALLFPKAEVAVPAKEWAYWMDDATMNAAPEAAKGGFQGVRRAFGAEAGKVRRFDWGQEIVPGVTALQADGHTPGHTAFIIASGKEQMMYVADITNNPAIFAKNPDFKAVFDMDADRAIATRKAILDRAAADKIRLSFYHGAFPSTGFVAKSGNGYDFNPAFWS
ncbi:MBL fold metallo-hydrolase [Prosthecomicrobium sp. N25]|uniref:MBL fold metallo-hydrolase n=1 Tax=Prosthecomicrobium sp. N25 TaxID=3129254 RepID=UPI0030788354